MKKKSMWYTNVMPFCLPRKILLIMRISVVLLFAFLMQVSAISLAQKVVVKNKQLTYEQLFDLIESQTGLRTFSSSNEINLDDKIFVKGSTYELEELLKEVVEEAGLTYDLIDDYIVVRPLNSREKIALFNKEQQPDEKIEISGTVRDENGQVIPGVNVYVKDGTSGTITDSEGKYELWVKTSSKILIVSFIGMETQEITLGSGRVYNIVIKEDVKSLDGVTITSYVERNKNAFSGAISTVKGSDLIKVSQSDVFKALSIADPSLVVVENNTQGSNPNNLPNIIIRGTTSINASNRQGLNAPLIVIDGIEASIRALYDMDIFDIESVSILKDASATALYGEKASNGVIIVTRRKTSQDKIRVSYSMSGTFDFPDLTDYSLMNAKQKLELERIAGLYDDDGTGANDLLYNEKLALVNSGINTDWIAKPLRTGFSHNHSVNVSGRAHGMSYSVNGRMGRRNGVMKGDGRNNNGLSFRMNYNHNSKLMIGLNGDFDQYNSDKSNYGFFSDYVRANPYDSPYDQEGNLVKELSYNTKNPLYEASLSSFDKEKQMAVSASLNVRWNIKPWLYVKAFGSAKQRSLRIDKFISPDSFQFEGREIKGTYDSHNIYSQDYQAGSSLNLNQRLDDKGSLISLNIGGEFFESETEPVSFQGAGFYDDKLNSIDLANGFTEGGKPSGRISLSRSLAAFAATNIIYRSRYFVDGSYRRSGSSKFGYNQRFAPFWSVGAGWNAHNESFVKNVGVINVLRLRGSYGHTGSINFAPYQAITTYLYSGAPIRYGVAASPLTMGNEDLKWETTKSYNFGITSSLFNNRLDVNFDLYKKITHDLLVPVSMPPSTGVLQVNNNIGEQENRGFELSASYAAIRTDDLLWRVGGNIGHNEIELIKVGDVLDRINKANRARLSSDQPLGLFVEGESPTMIYAVRSAGIDPASGTEIYIKKDGAYTYFYDPEDKVAVGDRTPKFRGALFSNLTWKNISLGINMTYSYGGYIYNSSRAERIEKVNPKYNADTRAFTERWKQPGDVSKYILITHLDELDKNFHTTRFVEKENYLALSSVYLNYQFGAGVLDKIGFKRLSVGVNANELVRFSTVERERGLYYPYARGFSFTLGSTF